MPGLAASLAASLAATLVAASSPTTEAEGQIGVVVVSPSAEVSAALVDALNLAPGLVPLQCDGRALPGPQPDPRPVRRWSELECRPARGR